jgi:hypothetical protein
MRALAGLLVAVAFLGGWYYFYWKKMPSSDQGTAPTEAISLTGVRGDLLQIAQAERNYMAANGRCAALEELIATNSVTMSRPERAGYVYAVSCSSQDFSVTARHAPAPAGSPVRYPNLAIDAMMQVREIE